MSQQIQAGVLTKEMEHLLSMLPRATGLKKLARHSLDLCRLGQGSGSKKIERWAFLPLAVGEAISGDFEKTVPLAASLQLFKAAAEIFDDLEDADSAISLSSKHDNAVAINVATTLLILAEKLPLRLIMVGVDHTAAVRTMDLINSYYTIACAGQHLDLSLPPGKIVSEKTYLKIIRTKSAFAVECACAAAALVAGGNQQIVDLFGSFGRNLGIASQIANDIQGINGGTDIRKGKITLPLIYALTQTDVQLRERTRAILLKTSNNKQSEVSDIIDILFRSGAIQYSLVKMQLFKQRAMDTLRRINTKGIDVQNLKTFIE